MLVCFPNEASPKLFRILKSNYVWPFCWSENLRVNHKILLQLFYFNKSIGKTDDKWQFVSELLMPPSEFKSSC